MTNIIRGALYGALVGDALGVPYEFHYLDLPAKVEIEMQPPASFRRSHNGVPIGTWSDDGALMLALMDSLTENIEFNLEDFADKMLMFWRRGEYAVDNVVFDIGFQTQMALAEYEAGTPAMMSGGADERENGNGSLMRVLPVAFLPVDDSTTIRTAVLQSLPTHAHARSSLTCALYALIAKYLVLGLPIEVAKILAEDRMWAYSKDSSNHPQEMEMIIDGRKKGTGTGYVLDTYWSALDALEETDNFQDCLKYAIALGNDTDTTACVVGGLAGAYYSYEAIPERWLKTLRAKDVVDQYLNAFMKRHGLS